MSTVDESLAKALGREVRNVEGRTYWRWPGEIGEYAWKEPAWSTSFDACLRDIVPVLRARGIWVSIDTQGDAWVVFMGTDSNGNLGKAEGVSLPAAFCEAALAALEESK